jgi:hypothetical protein
MSLLERKVHTQGETLWKLERGFLITATDDEHARILSFYMSGSHLFFLHYYQM